MLIMLNIAGAKLVSDVGVASIVVGCPKLKKLVSQSISHVRPSDCHRHKERG